jgi:adenosylhomocysteinase
MAFHLSASQLRVVRKYTREKRNQTLLANSRFILLEHLLPTTEEYIGLLSEAGCDIFAVIGKPYSIDQEVLKRLQDRKIRVELKQYDELENSTFLEELLNSAIEQSKLDEKKIIVLDVGGYFAAPCSKIGAQDAMNIAGIVEDTTFGHNRYKSMEEGKPFISKMPIPVFSVARSALKEIEARFVGKDAVMAADYILRKLGVSLAGRHALVLGYGMIGKNVARVLRANDMQVSVYDVLDERNLRAFIDGFHIHKSREVIKHADIIFAATATEALNYEYIEECKDNVILASVGSKDTEFDVHTVKLQAVKSEKHGEHIVEYYLDNSNRVNVMNNGTAINFILPSMPVEILDLVFSEILLCALKLLKQSEQYSLGNLHVVDDKSLQVISKDWLRSANK